jgi:hypothetical protein
MLSIAALEAVLPAMTRWRAPSTRAVDWAAIERELGTALPSDYRALAEAYPTLVIDDFLAVGLPAPGSEAQFVRGFWEAAEILRDLWEVDESQGYAPHPEPGGLLCWGTSPSGDQFYWKVDSPDPDAWPVTVFGHNDDWSEHAGGVVKFLADVFARRIHVPGLPAAFPGAAPQVKGIS